MVRRVCVTLSVILAVVAIGVVHPALAQQKKLVLWTMFEQSPTFAHWYATRGKDFAKKSGYEVEAVIIPTQGYNAKYVSAMMGRTNAPDIFIGNTFGWCGQYDFCDKMPPDLAKRLEENVFSYLDPAGQSKDIWYGMPMEGGNFQQLYINAGMFQKAGLNPDKQIKKLDEWVADMKKLTIYDTKGEPVQVGYGVRYMSSPEGITDKFLPFAHAFGARLLSPDCKKALGFANSPEMVAALQFFGDLVNKEKVSSLTFGMPADAFTHKRAAMITRESWFYGWVEKNAPDISMRVHPLPCGKVCPGPGSLFPFSVMVYKNSPNKQIAWDYLRFISNAKDDLEQHELDGLIPTWKVNLESAYMKARPDYLSTKEMLSRPAAPAYNHPRTLELAAIFGKAVETVLYGKGQPKPLLDEAAAQMERLMKE